MVLELHMAIYMYADASFTASALLLMRFFSSSVHVAQ